MVNRLTKKQVKQQTQSQTEPQYNDYFEAMKTGNSEVTPSSAAPDFSEQLSELMKRVDALTAQNEVLRSQAPQVQYVPVQQQAAPQEDVLPDPILDGNNFAYALLQRADALAEARIEAFKQEQAEKSNSADAYDKLWENFLSMEGNDVWEGRPEQVQVAAIKVSKRLAQSGIDANTYMFQHSDKFFEDVSKTLEADFGRPKAAEEDDDGEVDRTAGLAGGQSAPVTRQKGGQQAMPDLTGDLVAIQRKGGWY